MYNKKDAADLAASFLSFAKSGGVFQQSEKVFPVRFLQHGIDCIIQLGFLCIVKSAAGDACGKFNEVACRSRRVFGCVPQCGMQGGFQRCSLQLLFKGHLITLLRFYPTPWKYTCP